MERNDFTNFLVFYPLFKEKTEILEKILQFEPNLPSMIVTDDFSGQEKKDTVNRFLLRFLYSCLYLLETFTLTKAEEETQEDTQSKSEVVSSNEQKSELVSSNEQKSESSEQAIVVEDNTSATNESDNGNKEQGANQNENDDWQIEEKLTTI